MPFFDDTGVDSEVRRGPFWGVFATLRDQLERLVALNLVWSLQLVPALVAWGWPELPALLRAALVLYSLTALAPATGLLFGLAADAARGEHLGLDLARDRMAALWRPSLTALAPLYGSLGALWLLATWAAAAGPALFALDVLARLLLLVGVCCATYWGPIFAAAPGLPAHAVARRSLLLAWRYPGRTLLALGASALAALIGLVSVGGLFLAAPVLVALFQTHMYQEVSGRARSA